MAVACTVPTTTPEPSGPYTSIATIGNSQVDDDWESRKVPIWSSKTKTASEFGDDSADMSMTMRRRGPFFTGDDEYSEESFDIDFESQIEQLCDDLHETTEARTQFLRDKAKSLRDEGGVPLSEAKAEELANDPLSHMLWAVKLNIKAYQETISERGDYFQRQWTAPASKLVDHSASGKNSFFTAGCPSSDEVVVFKGRGPQVR